MHYEHCAGQSLSAFSTNVKGTCSFLTFSFFTILNMSENGTSLPLATMQINIKSNVNPQGNNHKTPDSSLKLINRHIKLNTLMHQ